MIKRKFFSTSIVMSNLFYERTLFFILCIVIFFIYFPSLFHLPRADHLWYLLDTVKTNDLPSLIKDFYSYNRVRLYSPGDTLAFRPVMFILLGLEKWAFGTNYIYPQIIGIILHLILIWRLFKLLNLINHSFISLVFVAYFSTLSIIMDLVIWSHINAYILFMILILTGVYHLVLYIEGEDRQRHHLIIIAVCLLIACFSYEAGIFYAILFFIYTCLVNKQGINTHFKWRHLLIFLPVVLYVILDIFDYLQRNPYLSQLRRQQYDMSLISQINLSNLGHIISLSFKICYNWVQFGLMPTIFRMYPGPRFGIYPMVYVNNINLKLDMIVNVIAVIVLITYLINNISFRLIRNRIKFITLITLMFVIYLEFIVIGRALERGIENVFGMCTYYSYFAWVYFIIILYSIIDFNTIKKLHTWHKWILLISVVTLIYLNSSIVYNVNLNYAQSLKPKRLFINKINSFIKAHRNEPNFSFKIYPHPPEDEIINIQEINIRKDFYLSEILFGRYINEGNPKYILLLPLLPNF